MFQIYHQEPFEYKKQSGTIGVSVFALKTSLGRLLLTFHVTLGFVSLLACGRLCLLPLPPRGGRLLGCFLLQHGPVEGVVVLVVQSPVAGGGGGRPQQP